MTSLVMFRMLPALPCSGQTSYALGGAVSAGLSLWSLERSLSQVVCFHTSPSRAKLLCLRRHTATSSLHGTRRAPSHTAVPSSFRARSVAACTWLGTRMFAHAFHAPRAHNVRGPSMLTERLLPGPRLLAVADAVRTTGRPVPQPEQDQCASHTRASVILVIARCRSLLATVMTRGRLPVSERAPAVL